MKTLTGLGLLACLAAQGCGFRIDKNPNGVADGASKGEGNSAPFRAEPGQILTFADVQKRIFEPQCLRCHDANSPKPRGHVTLNTYEDVTQFIDRIKTEALVKKKMPPRQPLSDADQALLSAWIEEGAPQ